jgi:hypothetical protein
MLGGTTSLDITTSRVDQEFIVDDGTGQFANWNGPGQPYESGQGYLV